MSLKFAVPVMLIFALVNVVTIDEELTVIFTHEISPDKTLPLFANPLSVIEPAVIVPPIVIFEVNVPVYTPDTLMSLIFAAPVIFNVVLVNVVLVKTDVTTS